MLQLEKDVDMLCFLRSLDHEDREIDCNTQSRNINQDDSTNVSYMTYADTCSAVRRCDPDTKEWSDGIEASIAIIDTVLALCEDDDCCDMIEEPHFDFQK